MTALISRQPTVPSWISQDAIANGKDFEIGTYLGTDIPFWMSEDHLSIHSCVLGSSGSGKSKFLELVMRYLTVAGQGFALIDPHGDLADDVLAFAAYLKASGRNPAIAEKIHYLEPSFERTFSFDPFRFNPSTPVSPDFYNNAYTAWLRAKADHIAEIFQRKQNQANFEGMPRLQRVLTDVLVATGTNVNGTPSEHLPLADAMSLLDFSNKERHAKVYDRIRPFLEPEIASDFDRIVSCKNEDQRLKETESTINRLRSLFSPIVKAIFAQQAESIDFRSIVQNGEILLVNLRETQYFSADQRRALGGLFIHEILTTVRNEDERANRKRFHLIIDEAANFIADDLHDAMGELRKYRLSICLAAQDLSSFKKGELDLRPKVLSQCQTRISFQQTLPEDLDILAPNLGLGNLNFEKHFQIVDRPDGHDWVDVVEQGKSSTLGENWNRGKQIGTASTLTDGLAVGAVDGHGSASGFGATNGSSESRRDSVEARSVMGTSHSDTYNETSNSMHNDSLTRTESNSRTENESESSSFGGMRSSSESQSFKKVPLSRTREESHETPSLRNSVEDQFWRMKQMLFTLGQGQAVAKILGVPKAVLIQTAEVKEQWTKAQKYEAIRRMKARCQEKPYFSVPDLSPQASEARIADFTKDPDDLPLPPAVEKNGNGHSFGA